MLLSPSSTSEDNCCTLDPVKQWSLPSNHFLSSRDVLMHEQIIHLKIENSFALHSSSSSKKKKEFKKLSGLFLKMKTLKLLDKYFAFLLHFAWRFIHHTLLKPPCTISSSLPPRPSLSFFSAGDSTRIIITAVNESH